MAALKKLVELLPDIESLPNSSNEDLGVDERTRQRIYEAARKVMLHVETDAETMQRIDLAPIQLGIIKLAYDIQLFEEVAEGGVRTLDELASTTNVDVELLSRILKFCAAHGMIAEVGVDQYGPSRMTRSFAIPGFKGAVISHHATTMRAAQALPDFLAKTDYANPKDANNCALQLGIGSEETFFEYLNNHPYISESFNNYMAAVRLGLEELGNLYNFEEHWGQNTSEETPLFVDIGGGSGHQCMSLRRTTNGKGRVILQDLPNVVENVSIDKVEVMPHSFFNEQPVKGAKVYYFRTILHDCLKLLRKIVLTAFCMPDDDCRKILKNIYDAMSDESIILLDERVVSDRAAHWIAMNMDLSMMLLFAAGERTESQWGNLLASVSLKIKQIHKYTISGACLIEAVKM